jgi:peroxiredoxin
MLKRGRRPNASWLITVLAALLPLSAAASDAVCNAQRKKASFHLTLKDVAGKDVSLSRYRGQVILLDFWATWCAPCRVEIPHYIDLQRQYGSRGFTVLGVSMDTTISLIEPFVEELAMNYPVLIGAGREDLSEAYGPFVGFPTSFLIARDGSICARHTGLWHGEDLQRAIDALL